MYLKILKKDLKRKKAMNIILLLFVIMATTFIASSLNNLLVAVKGTDGFMDVSGVKDFIIVTLNSGKQADEDNESKILKYLESEKYVEDYSQDDIVYLNKSNVLLSDGDTSDVTNSMIASCYDIKQQKFFDSSNHEITSMSDGTIYIPLSYLNDNKLKIGDKLTITNKNGYKKEFEIVGTHKDAALGAEMMGSHRYLFSKNDFEDLKEKSDLTGGSFISVSTSNLEKFKNNYNKQPIHTVFSGDKSLIGMSYVMDMIVAAVLIIVSICLIIISIVMLKFIITFSVSEDYKEIGIMKAIGLKNKNIRMLYASKYFAISIIGGLIGFGLSIPFGNIMMKQVTQNMVLNVGNSIYIIQFITSAILVSVITLFAYVSTGKIKKLSPMDAIRSGNNGERFKRKGLFALAKSKLKPTTFMAINDVLSEKRKYIALLITSIVGIWLVSMPALTIDTLRSEKIAKWFSLLDCDMYISSDEDITKCITSHDVQVFYDYMDKVEDTLEKNNIKIDRKFMEVIFKYQIEDGDKAYQSFALQGLGTKADEYMYEEGIAPKYENEVALAYGTAKALDAKIGDKVKINIGGEKKEFIVTAFYQTMNNMGDGIRFTDSAKLDYSAASGGFGVQICLKGNYDSKELEKIMDKTSKLFKNSNVTDTKGFINSMIGGIADRLTSLKLLILTVVTAIIILVVVLMQKMFLLRERGEMGMLKSIGFTNKNIIKWQTKRIGAVIAIGIIIGLATAIPFAKLTSGQAFKMMGASSIEFAVNPLEVFVIYPLIIYLTTLLICIVTMLPVKKINVQDMNNIE